MEIFLLFTNIFLFFINCLTSKELVKKFKCHKSTSTRKKGLINVIINSLYQDNTSLPVIFFLYSGKVKENPNKISKSFLKFKLSL